MGVGDNQFEAVYKEHIDRKLSEVSALRKKYSNTQSEMRTDDYLSAMNTVGNWRQEPYADTRSNSRTEPKKRMPKSKGVRPR